MIEDESHVEPKAVAGSDHFDAALLYDFAKFLTTLSLLALGGVLTLSHAADKQVAKPLVIAFVAGSIALAGVLAVSSAARLANVSISKRKQTISAQHLLNAAVGFLGIGAGGFLVIWWNTL